MLLNSRWYFRLRSSAETATHPRHRGLPAHWGDSVVAPLVFEVQREYEIPAARIIGRDEDDLSCYCAYSYSLPELCCDDDDVFYEAAVYAEELCAWRLRDGRWLVRRIVLTRDDEEESAEASYCLSEAMPR